MKGFFTPTAYFCRNLTGGKQRILQIMYKIIRVRINRFMKKEGENVHEKQKKISALLLAAAMTACAVPAQGAAADEPKVPKYIFLFIGDGMSYPQVQTTNYYLNAIEDDGDDILTSESKLNMMKFPVAGSAQTYDSTSFCPDSASTATSISTGHKTYSGTINMDEKMETSYEVIVNTFHTTCSTIIVTQLQITQP